MTAFHQVHWTKVVVRTVLMNGICFVIRATLLLSRHARMRLSGIQRDDWQLTSIEHWIPANGTRE